MGKPRAIRARARSAPNWWEPALPRAVSRGDRHGMELRPAAIRNSRMELQPGRRQNRPVHVKKGRARFSSATACSNALWARGDLARRATASATPRPVDTVIKAAFRPPPRRARPRWRTGRPSSAPISTLRDPPKTVLPAIESQGPGPSPYLEKARRRRQTRHENSRRGISHLDAGAAGRVCGARVCYGHLKAAALRGLVARMSEAISGGQTLGPTRSPRISLRSCGLRDPAIRPTFYAHPSHPCDVVRGTAHDDSGQRLL